MSITELKRRLTPGTPLRLVASMLGPVAPEKQPRIVVAVRSRDIIMRTPEGKQTYLGFQSGDKVAETPTGFVVYYRNPGSPDPPYILGAEYAWEEVSRG